MKVLLGSIDSANSNGSTDSLDSIDSLESTDPKNIKGSIDSVLVSHEATANFHRTYTVQRGAHTAIRNL